MASYRRYSDDEKAVALAFLAATGWKADGTGPPGALVHAARKAGVPHQRLSRWARQEQAPTPQKVQEKRAELADRIKDLAHSILDCLTDGRLEDAAPQALFVGLGITIEKLQLLNEQPTERNETTIIVERNSPSTLPAHLASGAAANQGRTFSLQRGGMWPPVRQDANGHGPSS